MVPLQFVCCKFCNLLSCLLTQSGTTQYPALKRIENNGRMTKKKINCCCAYILTAHINHDPEKSCFLEGRPCCSSRWKKSTISMCPSHAANESAVQVPSVSVTSMYLRIRLWIEGVAGRC